MKTTFLFVLLCSLLAAGTAQAQVIKHSYRFFNNFSTTSIECGPDLTPVPAEGSCNAAATPGGFVTDNLPQCGIGRTVYHTNMHWGLSYPNTSNTITHTYTIHIYVKTTDFGSRSWARIIDFSNGALDEGIYYKTSGVDDRRCLDFYPSGIVGDCPFFNASTYYLLTFTRNGATGIIDVYVNNKKFVSYNDAAGTYTGKPGTPITIYRDDRSVACESGAANIAFLSFTNQYSSQSVVNAVYDDICSIANSDNSADFSLSPNPVCGTGQDVVVRYTGDLVPPATGYTFTWDWDGGTVKSGSGMGPYTVTWPTAGTKNVRLTITRAACGGAINSSTRTHSLQVTGSPSSVIHKTICSGQQFEGYAATGTYVDRFTTASGCDSTRTLHLTVTARVTTTIDKTICQGQSYEGYSASGTYTDTYPSAGGCDSVRTLNLTVVSTLTSAVRETICAGARYTLPSGRQVGAGVYTETLRSAAGCDSVVTYTVREQAVQRSNLRPVVCAGTPYKLPSGRSVDQPGTYSDTLRYTTGCDSAIATVTLTVQSPARQTADAAVCAGQRYTLPSGRVVDAAGTYRDTLRYTTGCDSVLTTVRLTIHPVTDRTVTAAICSGQSYTLPSGRVVTVAGQYREVFTAQTGCDSIITTVLSVSDAVRRTEQAAICAGQRYTLPGGRTVSTAGLYEDRFRTAGGCDSIVVTLLTVHPAVRTQQSVFICAGALFTLPSGRKAGAGTYLDTLRAATGCDSIITTTVQERTVSRVAEQATVCAGSSYQLPSGRWVSAAGTYSDTLRYPGGCDSVIATIGLQVQAVRREAVPVSLCQGQVYALPSGRVVSVSGTYLDTLRYTSGCDSLLTTVTLTVTPRNA
ncbi:MAG TPA: PKD domain-containing protein, partial [Chitinophagaceae bacterium]|nr:PKD domain-containing protein [Chitinophagaceae bacterium]